MSRYQKEKENARFQAQMWQEDFYCHSYTYGQLVAFANYFEKVGRRYGLLKEFRANGIC